MSDFKLTTPVAFIIFNRPDTTERVFAEIAKAKPSKLLVVADGSRPHKEGEDEKVKATRAIIDLVDWPCEVLTNYSEVNLGCKVRVSSGLDWVFAQVEEAIILEDDCLPDPTFFRFCEDLLEKYRHDERVGMISGDNFQFGQKHGDASYYFSKYMHIWGWASWRRAWKNYDVSMRQLPLMKSKCLEAFTQKREQHYWGKIFESIYQSKIDTWDYQWFFCLICQNQLCVLPNVNLISNIGFGANATHTTIKNKLAEMEIFEMNFPIIHPSKIEADIQADNYTASLMGFNSWGFSRYIKKIFNILNIN